MKRTFHPFLPGYVYALFSFLIVAGLGGNATAADISVNPVRIFFNPADKTKTVSIQNHSDEDLTVQVDIYKWEQDDEAKPVYTPTEELIVFPRIVNFKKGAEQILRIGTRVPPGSAEQTYRVYVEEIPRPRQEPADGAVLRTYLRLGIPIYVNPIEPLAKGRIDGASVTSGTLGFHLRNEGNVHTTVQGISLEGRNSEGAQVFERELSGWHLLAGRSRRYSVDLPETVCRELRSMKISLVTDKFTLAENLDVQPENCGN